MFSNFRFCCGGVSARLLGCTVLIAILFVAGCASNGSGSAQFTVTTTSGQLATVVINSAYPQTTLTASNGTAPYTWAITSGALPAGLLLSSGGVLSGTPTAFGTFSFTVTVTDSATPSHTATAILSVSINPTLASVTLNPTTVTGGTSTTGTVTLNGAAAAVATVTLSSNSTAATVPATATVAAGATTATFQVTTSGVSSSTPVTITATFGIAKTAALTVNAPTVQTAALTLSTVTGGTGTTGSVTLTGPAATGGDSVTLVSDNAAAQVPATVTVPGGQTIAQFNVTTSVVGSSATAHIQATFNSSSQLATLTVVPAPTITSFTAAAATITSGSSTTLTGVFSNGTGSVSNGVGAVNSGAPATVSPTTTTTYTLTVTNAAGTAVTKQATVTVVAAPVITSFVPAAATITAGTSTTLTGVFSNGTGSVDNSVGAVISGTAVTVSPTSTTTYTLTVTNAAGKSVTAQATVTVVPAPVITSFTPGAATIVSGNSTTLTAVFSGGTGSVDHGVGAVISGTPVNITPQATTTYTLTVSNAATTPSTVTSTTTVTVDTPPMITSGSSVTFTVGSNGNFTVTTTGNPKPSLSVTPGSLPNNVTFHDNGDGTATISGIPATGTAGSHIITITAQNGVTPNATQSFTLTVALTQAPTITSANSTSFTVSTHGSFTVTTTGSPTPALTATGALPSGVTFADNHDGTATLAGTAKAGATSNLTITAANGIAPDANQSFTLNVIAAPSISGFFASPNTITAGNSTTLTANFINGTGSVNNGVGTVTSGTAVNITPAATTTYTLTVTNAAGTSVTATTTVTVVAAPVITSFTAAAATITAGTSTTLTAVFSNGTGTVDNNVGAVTSGTGVTVSPTTTTTYTLTVTNAALNKTTSTVKITVHSPPAITSLNNTTFTVGVNGTFTVTTTGNPTPALSHTGSLPSPITFVDNGNGTATISGTPAGTSVTTFTITASNTIGSNATQSFTLTVSTGCTSNCTISGNVFGPANSGVTIALSGGPTSKPNTTTDSSGNYSFTGLAGGTYTVTPSLGGYTFSPSAPQVLTSASTTTQNFTETSTLASFKITGTLTYGGSKTGRTFIRVFSTNGCQGGGCSGAAGTSFSTAPSSTGTSYTVRGLQNGTYIVLAEIDSLSNGVPNASNAWGSSGTITISSSDFSGANITLTDPATPTPVAPSGLTIAPGNTFALVQYNQNNSNALQDNNGREIATNYKVYWGTDVNATNGAGSPATFAAHGTNNDRSYIVRNLAPGTWYFKMSALVGNTESSASTPVKAVLAAGTGAFTVSGAVTFPGTATGPLYVGLFDGKNSVIYGKEIPTPFSSGVTYSITGIPAGNYQAFAIIDQNNNGLIEPSDISNVSNNHGGPPALTVSGNITNNNIALTSAVSTIDVTTNHQQFNGSNDSYGINFNLSWGTKRPVAMTLISGPNEALPWDMTVDASNGIGTGLPNGVVPVAGDTYQFQMTFSDGSTQTLPSSITAVLNSFAQSMAMQTTSPGSVTVPLLTWVTPASTPSPYTYQVGLYSTNGSVNVNWNDHGGHNSNGLPSGTTSVLFNADNSASVSSLPTATNYNWYVQVQDDIGNSSQETESYNIP